MTNLKKINLLSALTNNQEVYTRSIRNADYTLTPGEQVVLTDKYSNIEVVAVVNSVDSNWNASFKLLAV